MSMLLQCKETSKPHPEGIYSGVCVDVVDLGLVEVEFQGERRLVPKVRVFFETEYRDETGKAGLISKTFTASLHQKARLSEYIGKWRGRPVVPGESIDLAKLVGASCTLVISQQQNMVGRTYGAIDAVSKPTKKVAPSGQYDPAETRRRIAEWKAKEEGGAKGEVRGASAASPAVSHQSCQGAVSGNRSSVVSNQPSVAGPGPAPAAPKSAAASQAAAAEPEFDPEVGF
jgi:hypothetical protein